MKNLDISEKLASGTRHITKDKPNSEVSDPIVTGSSINSLFGMCDVTHSESFTNVDGSRLSIHHPNQNQAVKCFFNSILEYVSQKKWSFGSRDLWFVGF